VAAKQMSHRAVLGPGEASPAATNFVVALEGGLAVIR
jgi:hypothetical protein